MKKRAANAGRDPAAASNGLTPAGQRMLDGLRQFHTAGHESRREHRSLGYGKVMVEAERCRLHPEMLRKARRFADEYSPKDLDRLIADCEKHGHALGLRHIIRLLSVASTTARLELQERAVRQRWSVSRLDAAILTRAPSRRPDAGRRPTPPVGPADARLRVARMCDHWLRFTEVLCGPAGRRAKLPESVLRQVAAADGAVRALRQLTAASPVGRHAGMR